MPSTQPDGAGPLPDEIGRPASPSWREADAKRHQRVPQPPREPVNVVGQRHACTGDGPGTGGVILFLQMLPSSDWIVWTLRSDRMEPWIQMLTCIGAGGDDDTSEPQRRR